MSMNRQLWLPLVAGGVADIENVNCIVLDGEYNAMPMNSLTAAAIEQFPDFLGKPVVFRRKWAAARVPAKCVDLFD